MNLPESIRDEIKDLLWKEADRLEWSALSAKAKARYYTIWTEAEQIGGRLAGFMDPRQVRVYIKDTLLKSYTRERFSNEGRVFRILGLPADAVPLASYIKPHGRRLSDRRQIAWSRATEWKATLMALHERCFEDGGMPYAAVFFEAGTKHADNHQREIVESAARKLGIGRLVWVD
jgi:hypothetical protein